MDIKYFFNPVLSALFVSLMIIIRIYIRYQLTVGTKSGEWIKEK